MITDKNKTKYTNYTTRTCEMICAMRSGEEGWENLISINCAKDRVDLAWKQGYIPESVSDHFYWLISELQGTYEHEVGAYYSFQDMLNDHFEALLKLHFNSNHEINPLPIKCYQSAYHQAISDYARELSVIDDANDRYTLTDVTGVDILADKYAKYMSFGGEKFEFDCDVCECLERIGLDPAKDYAQYMAEQENESDMSANV